MSADTFYKLWPGRHLEPSDIVLRTYSGEQIMTLGSVDVMVSHNYSQMPNSPLLVVDKNGPSLFVPNWLKYMRINWKNVNYIGKEDLPSILLHTT